MSEVLRLSALLHRLADEHPEERISPHDLAAALRNRAMGALLLIFALPNLLPLPPGTTFVTGIPLIYVSLQMALGHSSPWFPPFVAKRSLTKAQLRTILDKALPWERKVERLLRPRLTWLTDHRGVRVIGLVSLLLSVVLWLPIPLGNHAPAATMTVFGLALVYRDGLAAIAGGLLAIASVALLTGLAWVVTAVIDWIIRNFDRVTAYLGF
jgi:hypothetical protein